MTDPQREIDPALELPATTGGHPDVVVDAPEVLDDHAFVQAVTGIDYVDVDLAELAPLGADRFGDDTPTEA